MTPGGPQRNQLVWLTGAAWQRVLAHPWDAPARALLLRWQTAQWPLVVTTQRGEAGAGVSLGLPAPRDLQSRKLALQVEARDLSHCQDFPAWSAVAGTLAPDLALRLCLRQISDAGATVQVFGSFGWQHITGLAYVHPDSDLDLRVQVPDAAVAARVVPLLRAAADHARLRLDGELAFPDGSAIAWREYAQWLDGRVQHVLVKSRTGAALRSLPLDACNPEARACCA